MTRKGRPFEILISKLESLKNSGAEIKSPEIVMDADTNTPREVDIGIRFKDSDIFIAIECRNRGSIQDIQWIEQLITKKNSIGANTLIAVTSSSFTEPAKIKAFKNGIVIRNVENINTDDIIALKETSYFETCYLSNIKIFINSITLIDPNTKLQQNPTLINFQNCFIVDKMTNKSIPFNDAINMSIQEAIQKVSQKIPDNQNDVKMEFGMNPLNHALLPYNYDLISASITINAQKEKIKYPLASVKKYKDSKKYDVLGEILGYNLGDNNLIIDKPSNTSTLEIDPFILQQPNKILLYTTVYSEVPTMLKNVNIKNPVFNDSKNISL